MKINFLAAASGLAFSAFLIASPVFAQGSTARAVTGLMPTACPPPIPRRPNKAQTAAINNQVGGQQCRRRCAPRPTPTTRNIRQQQQAYQAQQQQYQQQLEQESRAAGTVSAIAPPPMKALRARYAAERAAYHRGIWPDRYAQVGDRGARCQSDRRTRRTDQRQPRRHRDRHRPCAERQCLRASGAVGQRQDRLDRYRATFATTAPTAS